MNQLKVFDRRLQECLPETYALLRDGDLVVHPAVQRVALEGSRGLRGGFRPDSDIDLSLLVSPTPWPDRDATAELMESVLRTTLEAWHGEVEIDIAAVFDVRSCGLACFDRPAFDGSLCTGSGVDCFGLYKVQKGFSGFVPPIGVDVRLMCPSLVIWERDE